MRKMSITQVSSYNREQNSIPFTKYSGIKDETTADIDGYLQVMRAGWKCEDKHVINLTSNTEHHDYGPHIAIC